MDSTSGVSLTKYTAKTPDKELSSEKPAVSGTHETKSPTKIDPSCDQPSSGKTLDDDADDGSDKVELKRTVGLLSGSSFIIGTIIGSGIFISPQGVTAGAGSVGMSMMIWVICGLLSILGALAFAEIGTMLPVSGAEYSYVRHFYGDCLGFLTAWVYIILLQPSGSAVIALTCAEYILDPLFDDGCGSPPAMHVKILSVCVVFLLGAVNCYSVKLANQIQVIFTAAKVLALLIIIGGGLIWLFQGKTENISTGFDGTESDIGKIFMAMYSCFWSYSGWANLNYVTEEVQNPGKNLPRAIIIGLSVVIVVYLLTNLSYYTVLSVDEMLASVTVGVSWAEYVMPKVSWIIPVSVALSTFGACNGGLYICGRLCFVAGRNGHMMKVLEMVHVEKYTPFPAIAFTVILVMIYIFLGDVSGLMDLFNFVIWSVYALVMMQVIIMKFTHKHLERPFSVNISIPIIMFVASVILVIGPLITDPKVEYFIAIGIILFGLVFYIPIVHFKKYPPGLDSFTTACQLLLKVSPPYGSAKGDAVM